MSIEGMKDEGICPGEKVILISIFVFVWFDKSITNVYFLLPPTYDIRIIIMKTYEKGKKHAEITSERE